MIVVRAFCVSERALLVAQLASFDWDFSAGIPVRLVQESMSIDAVQVGSGNHEGYATLTLTAEGEWESAVTILKKMNATGKPIVLERK